MRILNLASFLCIAVALQFSFNCYADDSTDTFDIPTFEAINVFAHEQQLPAVVNYYTNANENEIIAFYTANYGDAISTETKRGRIMLRFSAETYKIRVIVSNQNQKRQVDVLVTK